MTALEEIKKALEGDMNTGLTAIDRLRFIVGGVPDFDPITVEDADWIISALESLQRENEELRKKADARETELVAMLNSADESRVAQIRRAEAAEAEVKRLRDLLRFSHDALWEINPSNYDHDDVCKLNDASVEVILAIAPELGETHGKSKEWWDERQNLASTGGEHHAE